MKNSKNKKFYIVLGLFIFIFIFISSTNTVIAEKKKKGAENVPAKKEQHVYQSSYKLLAPIGSNYTEVSTANISSYFNKIFTIAIGLAGVLAVVMLVIGGIEWMGSESVFAKTAGKEKIMSALLGLLIALGSYAILKTINPALLGQKNIANQINTPQTKK